MEKVPNSSTVEAQLLAQLADVDRRISDLGQERLALQRLLARARQQNVATKDVTRKNSFDRIIVEKLIIDKLSSSKKAISTKDLYRVSKYMAYDLKENTFRSYLHRLKIRGLIVNGEKFGTWTTVKEIVKQKSDMYNVVQLVKPK